MSDILSGKIEPGKRTCKRLSVLTGKPWSVFCEMSPEAIEAEILRAMRKGGGSMTMRGNP